jgi:hypothetical protein
LRREEAQKTPTEGKKHRHTKEEKICPCSFLSVWPRISRLRNEKRRRAEEQKTPTDGNKHRHPQEEKICPCSFLSVWPRISRLRNEE